MKTSNGCILYQGPSQLDGSPIVAILTGLQSASANRKTGDMLQTWILRADVSPTSAVKSGEDASICGNCAHRGEHGKGRTCYVTVVQAPTAVYRAFERGSYPRAAMDHYRAINARPVRFGAYGDPTAIPFDVWANVLRFTSRWTGYTHQWQDERFSAYQSICMASVDTEEEYRRAKLAGWRTFRVRHADTPKLATECICPASDEGKHRTTCADCILCKGNGSRAKDVVIVAHGTGRKYFTLKPITA